LLARPHFQVTEEEDGQEKIPGLSGLLKVLICALLLLKHLSAVDELQAEALWIAFQHNASV